MAAGLLLLAGCASRPPVLSPILAERSAARVAELTDTPFHPQQAYQCGPAALATLLGTSGLDVSPDSLTSQIYLPGRQGSLQAEIVAATRRHDRLPVVVEPTLAALLTALQAGHPVLVLQNLGRRWLPVWHYAVVIGFDGPADAVILRSGTERRKRMPARDFARSWALADNWGIVVLAPGAAPGGLDAGRYLAAAAGLEAVGRLEPAARAYATAARAWPGQSLAWLGMGNVAYRQGRPAAARDAYREALRLAPGDAVAANNLAQVLTELGCPRQAAAVLDALPALTSLPVSLRGELARTRRAVQAGLGSPDARSCVGGDR